MEWLKGTPRDMQICFLRALRKTKTNKQINKRVTNTCFVDVTNKADNLSRKKLPYLLTDTVKNLS